jgi:hypothetical protein
MLTTAHQNGQPYIHTTLKKNKGHQHKVISLATPPNLGPPSRAQDIKPLSRFIALHCLRRTDYTNRVSHAFITPIHTLNTSLNGVLIQQHQMLTTITAGFLHRSTTTEQAGNALSYSLPPLAVPYRGQHNACLEPKYIQPSFSHCHLG